jgi:hypothetical protein
MCYEGAMRRTAWLERSDTSWEESMRLGRSELAVSPLKEAAKEHLELRTSEEEVHSKFSV